MTELQIAQCAGWSGGVFSFRILRLPVADVIFWSHWGIMGYSELVKTGEKLIYQFGRFEFFWIYCRAGKDLCKHLSYIWLSVQCQFVLSFSFGNVRRTSFWKRLWTTNKWLESQKLVWIMTKMQDNANMLNRQIPKVKKWWQLDHYNGCCEHGYPRYHTTGESLSDT